VEGRLKPCRNFSRPYGTGHIRCAPSPATEVAGYFRCLPNRRLRLIATNGGRLKVEYRVPQGHLRIARRFSAGVTSNWGVREGRLKTMQKV
jgi:hypothetical protein